MHAWYYKTAFYICFSPDSPVTDSLLGHMWWSDDMMDAHIEGQPETMAVKDFEKERKKYIQLRDLFNQFQVRCFASRYNMGESKQRNCWQHPEGLQEDPEEKEVDDSCCFYKTPARGCSRYTETGG